jgi:hypothetical protein
MRASCKRYFFAFDYNFLYGATSKYLTMEITDNSDDDELVSGLSRNSDVSLIEDICLASLALSFRENKLLVARMNWHRHVQSLLHEISCQVSDVFISI